MEQPEENSPPANGETRGVTRDAGGIRNLGAAAALGRLGAWAYRIAHQEKSNLLKEGFEPSAHWAHVTAAFCALTSEVLRPVVEHCTLWVTIAAVAGSVGARLAIKYRKVSLKLGSGIFTFSSITAVLSLVLLGVQGLGGEVPGVEFLQAKLGIIETRIAAVKEDTEALRKSQAEAMQELAEIKALTRQLVAGGAAKAAPGAEQAVGDAVAAAAKGAAAGDERLQKALALLKANKVAEAATLFRAVAADKAARIKRDSKDAAAAYRNLGAIAGLGDPKSALDA